MMPSGKGELTAPEMEQSGQFAGHGMQGALSLEWEPWDGHRAKPLWQYWATEGVLLSPSAKPSVRQMAKRTVIADLMGRTFAELLGDSNDFVTDLTYPHFADPPSTFSALNRLPHGVTKSDTEPGNNGETIQKAQFSINLDLDVKPRFSNALKKEAGIFIFRSEMAAQGGIRDKILRVSMPFEKGSILMRKSR